MGLLDDAIREHLELKRRRGADSDEVERQAREALGSPRRAQFAGEQDEPASDVAAPLEDDELEPVDDEIVDAPPPLAPESAPAPASEPAPGPFDEPWLDDPDEVPPADALEPGQPTREFSAADVDDAGGLEPDDRVAPDDEPDAEDVLEETPDFLQETPEHDRLWFEQKPPKNFDWDS